MFSFDQTQYMGHDQKLTRLPARWH